MLITEMGVPSQIGTGNAAHYCRTSQIFQSVNANGKSASKYIKKAVELLKYCSPLNTFFNKDLQNLSPRGHSSVYFRYLDQAAWVISKADRLKWPVWGGRR